MHYYKHNHDMGMHRKWRGIAAELGVRPLDVYGIWNLLLEHASRQRDRGSVAQFRAADIAAQFDLEKSEVEAILTEFESRDMIAEGRIAKWEWYQRDLSTTRVQKHRQERRAADEGTDSPSGADPRAQPAQRAETEMKRDETHVRPEETQENKNKSKRTPLTPPPLRVIEGGREQGDFATTDGTPADAGAGLRLSEAELKKRKHDLVIQQVITEAARTMPFERYSEFALALCDPAPPRWARGERDRIWRQIKQERNARGAARAA
jgi:uncharacterized protein YdaU (DUF1376 family)